MAWTPEDRRERRSYPLTDIQDRDGLALVCRRLRRRLRGS
jgi:hypothetical protein